jgi:hypothetical protein
MIDFRKLGRPDPIEMGDAEQKRCAQEIADDRTRRTERARETITITLSHDAEPRFTRSGTRSVQLCGAQADGRQVRATWYAPGHATDDEAFAVQATLSKGAKLRLDGYWKPVQNGTKTAFTFIAQFIHPTAPTEEPRPRTSPEDQMNAL